MSEIITPFPYQIEGAQWLAPRAQALLADDMGLGKSCQAIRGADIIGAQNILVICPAAVRINWSREFERFSPLDRPCTVLFEAKEKLPASGVAIMSFEWATTNAHILKAKTWDLLIIDEAHYLKERSAKRTKAVYGHGAKRPGVAGSAKVVWRLTGTPAPNDASELYTHLKSMGGAKDEQYWDFTFRYCSGFDASFGYKITGHKNIEELKARLAPYMLRRKKEDVLRELPPIRYQEVTVDRSRVELDPEFYEQIQGQKITVEQFYDKLKVGDQTLRQALEATRDSGNPLDDRLRIIEGLAQNMVTLRRYIGMAKLPQCLDIIEEDLASGAVQKIVLFGVHQCVIEGARKRLAKYGAVTLYGLTPLEKRQQNIDKFQTNPKCRVFIGNVQAAGVGITLTAAHEVGFLEQDWVPANNSQATMRCHRIGQTNPVRVRVFSLHQSIDELVQQTLMRKARELAKIY
jgi:SWI/SNF-related matrix-associated actin-dependent regulator of chromatin subfamily A-like protein 1